MKTPVFVSFCVLLVGALVSMHLLFADSVGPAEQLRRQVGVLEKARASADLRSQLLAHELMDLQQHVATLVPEALKGRDERAAFPLRQLASIAAGGGEALEIERGSGLYEEAKAAFRDKDFETSNERLERLISQFPASIHVVEAHLLLAEGRFQLKEFEAAIQTIDRMIDLFPDNELTGFALLRLGHIFESHDRIEDAGDIYRAVLSNFKKPDLVEEATKSLKAVEL